MGFVVHYGFSRLIWRMVLEHELISQCIPRIVLHSGNLDLRIRAD